MRLPQQTRADGEAVLGELGPDAGQVSRVVLRNRLTGTRRQLKPDSQWKSLYRPMRFVLRAASGAGLVPDRYSWLTSHRDDADGRCPHCQARPQG
ncbi:MAG TPA: hypothetical protein VK053_23230 [Jiangellaceae bacterium]|nr:hypothetical protein [Jiangellaceae bacterium]